MKKNFNHQERSKFTALENHLLNTFFSGLYFSAAEFINIAHSLGFAMDMNRRELLIKELLNKSYDKGILNKTLSMLNVMIETRIQEYHQLAINYPHANTNMAQLAQKAKATQALLARESKANIYA